MNVDKATRLLNKMIVDEFHSYTEKQKAEIIQDFFNISDQNKPISFRNKSIHEISFFAININKEFRKIIKEILKKDVFSIEKSSNNNKIGSDITITFQEKNIQTTINGELKFGNKTDANIGLNTINEIFQFKNKEFSFFENLKSISKAQYSLLEKHPNIDEEELLKNLELLIQRIVIDLKNQEISINNYSLDKLLLSTGSISNWNNNNLLKFRIDYKKNIKNSISKIDEIKKNNLWKIKHIIAAKNNRRIEIMVIDSNNQYQVKFLLNWKNSFYFRQRRISSKCGLKTPCFNVWLKKL